MLSEYLQQSLDSDKKDELCRGWKFLKINLPKELKEILDKKEYWDLTYNTQKEEFILSILKEKLTEEQRKQLGSFVYIYNDKRRKEEEKQHEQDILNEGFIKIWNNQKEYDNKKVICIFIHTNSLGFDREVKMEGKIIWSDYHKVLMFIPKRHRTTGKIIQQFCYIKEV